MACNESSIIASINWGSGAQHQGDHKNTVLGRSVAASEHQVNQRCDLGPRKLTQPEAILPWSRKERRVACTTAGAHRAHPWSHMGEAVCKAWHLRCCLDIFASHRAPQLNQEPPLPEMKHLPQQERPSTSRSPYQMNQLCPYCSSANRLPFPASPQNYSNKPITSSHRGQGHLSLWLPQTCFLLPPLVLFAP